MRSSKQTHSKIGFKEAIIDSTRALEVREAAQTAIRTSTPVVTSSLPTSTIPTTTGTSTMVMDSSSAPVVPAISTVSTSALTITTVSRVDPPDVSMTTTVSSSSTSVPVDIWYQLLDIPLR